MRRHRTPVLSATGWPDHFSDAAGRYARYRPTYPEAFFDRLAALAPSRAQAWDCATGNGQAAAPLATRFASVVATDASTRQLAVATGRTRIAYVAATAEACPLAGASVDLITVAQAAHWLRLDTFYEEARRVAKPRGVLAMWTYGLFRVAPAVDELVGRFQRDVVGAYWPAQRVWVDSAYRDLPFPFEEIATAVPDMTCDWTLAQLVGYVRTWSAVKRYREVRGEDPVSRELLPALRSAWGRPARRTVRWPIGLRAGRLS